jgi:GcrA cell cycle regulator
VDLKTVSGMSWTDDRIELLRRLWDSGKSASQIADELGHGVTRNAVIGKAHRLGLRARPSPVKPEVGAKIAPAPTQPRRIKTEAKPARITLLDLNERICKWPIGHPGDEDFHFCGKPVNPGTPYCSEHCAVAYQAQLPRKDRRPLPPIGRPR